MNRRSTALLVVLLLAGCAMRNRDRETIAVEETDMQRIETERLVLRRFSPDDWRDVQEIAVDWKAAPGPAFDKWPTEEDACRDFTQYLSDRDNYLAVSLRGSGKVVGLLAINGIDEEKQADLGHVMLSKYQDGDHDREALEALVRDCFEARGVGSIITHNASEHAAQVAPLKALGFVNTNPDNPGELTLGKERWESIDVLLPIVRKGNRAGGQKSGGEGQ